MKTLNTLKSIKIVESLIILSILIPVSVHSNPAPISDGEIALFIHNVEEEMTSSNYHRTAEQHRLSQALTQVSESLNSRKAEKITPAPSMGAIELMINDVEEQMSRSFREEEEKLSLLANALGQVTDYYAGGEQTDAELSVISDGAIGLFIGEVEESMSIRHYREFTHNAFLNESLNAVTQSIKNGKESHYALTNLAPSDAEIARYIEQAEETMEVVLATQEISFTISAGTR